jgi:hypothetical protein
MVSVPVDCFNLRWLSIHIKKCIKTRKTRSSNSNATSVVAFFYVRYGYIRQATINMRYLTQITSKWASTTTATDEMEVDIAPVPQFVTHNDINDNNGNIEDSEGSDGGETFASPTHCCQAFKEKTTCHFLSVETITTPMK